MFLVYFKRKWNCIYLIICFINIIEFRNMNCIEIVIEYYYGIYKMSVFL